MRDSRIPPKLKRFRHVLFGRSMLRVGGITFKVLGVASFQGSQGPVELSGLQAASWGINGEPSLKVTVESLVLGMLGRT